MQPRETVAHRRPIVIFAALAWIIVVMIFFGVQTAFYRGLPRTLAEWEFDRFGASFPSISYVGLVASFASPALLLLPRWRRGTDAAPRRDLVRLMTSGRGILRLLVGVIAGVTVAALAVLIQIAGLPSAVGQPKRIDVSAAGPSAVLPEGPATLVGRYRAGPVGLFSQNLLIASRNYRFVPLRPASSSEPTLHVFVALSDFAGPSTLPAQPVGILRRAGLPGEITQMYRDAGYAVTLQNYVLYPNRTAMYWPLLANLATLLAILLVVSLAAYALSRQLRRVRAAVLTR